MLTTRAVVSLKSTSKEQEDQRYLQEGRLSFTGLRVSYHYMSSRGRRRLNS